MKPPFLTWRDLPEDRSRVMMRLGAHARCYFGGKTPELVLSLQPATTVTRGPFRNAGVYDSDGTLRPFAIGLQGIIRLEKLLGNNIIEWPGREIYVRRGLKRGFSYVEIVPELPQ